MSASCERHWTRSSTPAERGPSTGSYRLGGGSASPRLALLAALAVTLSFPGFAQDRLLLRGLGDVEAWNTGPDAEAFSRDDGETAALGRLRLWAVGSITDRLHGVLVGKLEGGDAAGTGPTKVSLEQAYLRYAFGASGRVIVQGGKLTLPFGNFAARYYSDTNPLVGNPLNYEISYPLGVQVNGAASRFDYMIAVVDGPLTREEYDSVPESAPRPALAVGVTPVTGLRVGVYFTRGEYLSLIAEDWLLPGKTLADYDETVAGLDLQYSIGHFELNGELTHTRLEVPAADNARGRIWYVEPKYTFSPRWFAALRWERGDQAEAYWIWAALWSAETERVDDLEAGVGFRIDPGLVLKGSYRTALGSLDSAAGMPRGHGVALQLSYRFDVNSWFERPR